MFCFCPFCSPQPDFFSPFPHSSYSSFIPHPPRGHYGFRPRHEPWQCRGPNDSRSFTTVGYVVFDCANKQHAMGRIKITLPFRSARRGETSWGFSFLYSSVPFCFSPFRPFFSSFLLSLYFFIFFLACCAAVVHLLTLEFGALV